MALFLFAIFPRGIMRTMNNSIQYERMIFMKKKLLVIVTIVLVLGAMGFTGYKFVYPKFVEKAKERKEVAVKEKVIESDQISNTERLMESFVNWMNNEERTKAKLVELDGELYAVVTYYKEDGSGNEKVYNEEDVIEFRDKRAKELGITNR